MKVCYKCARWNCDTRCRNPEIVSINREDKIWCIKDRLSKESLDDIYLTLEAHPSGDVHRVLLNLFWLFQDKNECYHPKDLTINDLVCWFFKKIERKVDEHVESGKYDGEITAEMTDELREKEDRWERLREKVEEKNEWKR